jgi:hypothetical protein
MILKIISKPRIEGYFFNLTKTFLKIPTANSIPKSENFVAFLLRTVTQ